MKQPIRIVGPTTPAWPIETRPALGRRSAGLLLLLAGILSGAALAACQSVGEEPIPELGIAVEAGRGKELILSATGRASAEAIASGSLAMKQTTACDAAKRQLERELRDERYVDPRRNFAIGGVFLIRGNEYCRIVGVYNPDGVSTAGRRGGPDLQLDL